jgi:hypothetical protein
VCQRSLGVCAGALKTPKITQKAYNTWIEIEILSKWDAWAGFVCESGIHTVRSNSAIGQFSAASFQTVALRTEVLIRCFYFVSTCVLWGPIPGRAKLTKGKRHQFPAFFSFPKMRQLLMRLSLFSIFFWWWEESATFVFFCLHRNEMKPVWSWNATFHRTPVKVALHKEIASERKSSLLHSPR